MASLGSLKAEAVLRGDELHRSIQCEAHLRSQIFDLRDEVERLQAPETYDVCCTPPLCRLLLVDFSYFREATLLEEQVRSSKVAQATAALQAIDLAGHDASLPD